MTHAHHLKIPDFVEAVCGYSGTITKEGGERRQSPKCRECQSPYRFLATTTKNHHVAKKKHEYQTMRDRRLK
jgi:hypothetical protein